jgi:uncharacterized small protein (DUF1192 family)
MQGSHDIDESEDKVVIRRLELFSGFDPTIDDGSDEEIKRFDRRKVARIVDRTRQFISRRQHPRLVIMHAQEDHSEPKEAVGAILDVQLEERNGVPFVVGDVEMSRGDFDSYIASNRYPRRSAEIWNDDHMSEVALLGRDTPRRPLPDTRFSKQGEKTVFAIECSSCFEAAPGVGNVFVPGAAVKKKESNMADEAKPDEKKDEKDEMSKLIAEKDAEIARLKEENRKMYNQTHVDIDSHEGDEDEDEEEKEDDKAKAMKSKHSKSGDKLEFARMKEKFEKRIAALETELAKERFSRELDSMAADGFAVDCCRDEMIEELVSSSNPQRKIAFWRENFRRDPINTRIAAAPRSGVKPAQSGIDRETVAKLVAEAAGDSEKFKTLMARAKSGV